MSYINWALPKNLFAGVNDLLAPLPDIKPVVIKLEKPLEEMLNEIDLGGFVMHRREITAKDFELLVNNIKAGEMLSVNGKAVAIYIEDRTGIMPTDDVECLPKVHIVNCGVTDIRPKRYVMVVNPNGMFDICFSSKRVGYRLEDKIRRQKALRICIRCKQHLVANAKGIDGKFNLAGKSVVWNELEWKAWNKFVSTNYTSTGTTYMSIGITPCIPALSLPQSNMYAQAGARPIDKIGYAADWYDISKHYRTEVGWKCCDCGVNCESWELRRFLDVHHINRNKQDNTSDNLRVLCRLCHRNQGADHGLLERRSMLPWKLICIIIKHARNQQGITA